MNTAINYTLLFLLLAYSLPIDSQTKTFHHLNKYEQRWVLAHPFAALKIKKEQGTMFALYREVKESRVLDTFENGGKLDAFRHTFAMAYFSKFVKVNKLRKLGIAHEKANYVQFLHHKQEEAGEMADSLSRVMDLQNNEIALHLAKEVKTLSAEEVKQKIILLIQSGKTYVMRRNKQGQYLDCSGTIIPQESLRVWRTPKCLVMSKEG